MQDFHVRSLHGSIEPMMLQLDSGPDLLQYLAIRIAPDDVSGTMKFLKNNWCEIYLEYSFAVWFLDEDLDRQYQNDA